ncbi:MAG: hypothetical protein Fur0018_07710 [Anaerolineales bacterium]
MPLKEEAGGKLFPVSDRARDVLAALLDAVHASGGTLLSEHRVTQVERLPTGFRLRGPWGVLETPKVILATGGQSLPQTGSDGSGYALAQSLGHTLTPHLLPALVPLTLPPVSASLARRCWTSAATTCLPACTTPRRL